jgi:hypothetical protein
MQATTVGIDLAKNVFCLDGCDEGREGGGAQAALAGGSC